MKLLNNGCMVTYFIDATWIKVPIWVIIAGITGSHGLQILDFIGPTYIGESFTAELKALNYLVNLLRVGECVKDKLGYY